MVTRSIVGRFLILAILLVAVGIVAQAALIITQGGKKTVKTAAAAPASSPAPVEQADAASGDPVRVVYPGPLGDAPAQKPKLTDTAAPLAAPAPQTTAKLAQAMAATAPAPSQPAASVPVPAPQPASPPATVAADPAPAPASQSASPAPAEAAAEPQPASPAPAPAGVEVASLGGGAPAAETTASVESVNINTASVEALNRLGGGHIGQSIANHRPYRSVEDLVKKRVLRRSVFDHIRNQIAAR